MGYGSDCGIEINLLSFQCMDQMGKGGYLDFVFDVAHSLPRSIYR